MNNPPRLRVIQRRNMYSRILASLSGAPVLKVRIGINWTAVVVEKDGKPRCGLASTLAKEHDTPLRPGINTCQGA